jgi:hypothetical protein
MKRRALFVPQPPAKTNPNTTTPDEGEGFFRASTWLIRLNPDEGGFLFLVVTGPITSTPNEGNDFSVFPCPIARPLSKIRSLVESILELRAPVNASGWPLPIKSKLYLR